MDADRIVEMFAVFGPVVPRRMFSGFGVFSEGTMFALVARDTLYLKADRETVAAFATEGQGPFTYAAKGAKGGKRSIMSYWRAPDRLYDDPDELATWAREALAAAHRSGRKRTGRLPRVRRPRSRAPARPRDRSRR
jgi:DNA transformation protein